MSKKYASKMNFLISISNSFITDQTKKLKWAERFSLLYFHLAQDYIYRFIAKNGTLDRMLEVLRSEEGAQVIYNFIDSIETDELLSYIDLIDDISDEKTRIDFLFSVANEILYGYIDLRISFFGERVVTKHAKELYDAAIYFVSNGMAAQKEFFIALMRYLISNILIRFSTYIYGKYQLYKKENFLTKYKSAMKRKKLHLLLMKHSQKYKALFLELKKYVRGRAYGDLLELWHYLVKKSYTDPKYEDIKVELATRFNNGNFDIRKFIDSQKDYVTNKLERYGKEKGSKEEGGENTKEGN